MRISKTPGLALFFLAFSGCAGLLSPPRVSWPPLPNGFFMNVGVFIQITGTGSADKTVLGETQRKSMGRDAAILDAWQRTRDYLASFVLPSGRTVGEKAAGDEQYNKRLETLVHGAQIVSTQYDEDQTAVAVLRLDRRIIQNTLGTDYK